jgi:hypothetical protein
MFQATRNAIASGTQYRQKIRMFMLSYFRYFEQIQRLVGTSATGRGNCVNAATSLKLSAFQGATPLNNPGVT